MTKCWINISKKKLCDKINKWYSDIKYYNESKVLFALDVIRKLIDNSL